MRAGFEYYRAFPQDVIENQNYSKTKLTMPVLAVGGEYYPAFAGNVTSNSALYAMKTLAQNVRGMRIHNSGHWIPGAQYDVIIKLLDSFFGGNTTNTRTSDPILRNQQVSGGNSCMHTCKITL
ncbi:MAG: hypothetical protein WBZ36_13980 [Candidatus Nitrosopolaris sp.]